MTEKSTKIVLFHNVMKACGVTVVKPRPAFVALFFGIFLIFAPLSAQAACSSPAGVEGKMMYNGDYKTMQFCDGTDWIAMSGISPGAGGGGSGGGGLAPGDVLSDGTIFAGIYCANASLVTGSDDVCWPLYVPAKSQGTSVQWKNSTGVNDIDPEDLYDGQVNHANRSGNIADFPALQLCEDLQYGGHTDWYLPSRIELGTIYANKTALSAAGVTYLSTDFWSSSEASVNDGWSRNLTDGATNSPLKTAYERVICVRRD